MLRLSFLIALDGHASKRFCASSVHLQDQRQPHQLLSHDTQRQGNNMTEVSNDRKPWQTCCSRTVTAALMAAVKIAWNTSSATLYFTGKEAVESSRLHCAGILGQSPGIYAPDSCLTVVTQQPVTSAHHGALLDSSQASHDHA